MFAPSAPVEATLHWISPTSREVIRALSTIGGLTPSANAIARHVRCLNRHQLARRLAEDGLPPLQVLRAWIRLVTWVLSWQATGTSLYSLATAEGLDPAVCYRTIKKITGLRWREVCTRGAAWVLLQLTSRCDRPRYAIVPEVARSRAAWL